MKSDQNVKSILKWYSPKYVFGRSESKGRARSIHLDILRAVAILLVLGIHNVVKPSDAGVFYWPARIWANLGWTGVDLFFVLSGFLIGGLLFEEIREKSQLKLTNFLIRRGFKIWPPYITYLIILMIFFTYKNQYSIPWDEFRDLIPNFLHMQNYFGTPRLHTWSLAVEEHFYLLLPLLLMFLCRKNHRFFTLNHLPWLIAGLIFIVIILRMQVYIKYSNGEIDNLGSSYLETHLRSDGLMLGVLVAYFYHFKPEKIVIFSKHPIKMLLLGCILVSPSAFIGLENNIWMASVGLFILYVGYAIIMLSFMNIPLDSKLLGNFFTKNLLKILGFIGFFSYPIYLFHPDFAQYPMEKLIQNGWLSNISGELRWIIGMGSYIFLAIVAGVFFGVIIEKPFLTLRDYLFPHKGNALTRK